MMIVEVIMSELRVLHELSRELVTYVLSRVDAEWIRDAWSLVIRLQSADGELDLARLGGRRIHQVNVVDREVQQLLWLVVDQRHSDSLEREREPSGREPSLGLSQMTNLDKVILGQCRYSCLQHERRALSDGLDHVEGLWTSLQQRSSYGWFTGSGIDIDEEAVA